MSVGASPSANPPSDAEGVFRELIAAINSGDAEAGAALIAEDATIYGDNVSATGIEDVLATFVCTAEIVSVEADGDSAIVELNFTGQAPLATSGDCPEGPAGRHRVSIRDGQIIELEEAGPG